MEVRFVVRTPDNVCKSGSWLDHWRESSGQPFLTFCAVVGCLGRDLVGAQVQKLGGRDSNRYVVPLCTDHTQTPAILTIGDVYNLVPAAGGETRGAES